jgi:AraC-like DNA-binding protein
MLQIELNNPNFVSLDRPFDMEIVFYFCRSLLGLFYIRLIDKMLLESTNTRIITGWKKLFLPIKINIYAITIFFLANQIILRVFGYTIPRFYIINVSAIIASGMLFWHILLAIKDLENPESIFNDQIKPSVPTIQAPEKILFILKQISEQKMYQDPLVSVGSIANKFDMSEEKFASEFNNNIPFSFSSYINYLRLINFEKNSNSKYSKEANILNAGFNSRASYYQWEKRRAKLALQIDPILESFEPLT